VNVSALKSVLALATRALDAAAGLGRLAEMLRERGLPVGAAVALLGIVLLTLAGRFPRGLAVAGGAVLGALAAIAFRAPLATHVGVSLVVAAPVLATVVAAACAFVPLAFPVAVGALPGLLLGLEVPLAGRAAIGGAVGALVAGGVALLFARVVAIGSVSALGGVLAATGAVAIGGARPLARELSAHPLAILALALVLSIAGAAYQLARGGLSDARADAAPLGLVPVHVTGGPQASGLREADT
jgi:hypothetical protein